MMRKKILFSIGLLVCIGVAAGIYWYQKPRENAAGQKTDFALTAAELYRQYETNEAVANQQYEGKVLEVSGTVGTVQQNDSTMFVLLTAGDAMGGVNCSMADAGAQQVQPGKTITVKGRCAGFLMDVSLLDAVVLTNQ